VLRSTGNLLVTRDLLRHNSVATTEIYAKMMDDSGFQAVAGL
jgi:site-specific recombinase XerC